MQLAAHPCRAVKLRQDRVACGLDELWLKHISGFENMTLGFNLTPCSHTSQNFTYHPYRVPDTSAVFQFESGASIPTSIFFG